MAILFKTLDDAFLNTAYLSELWAVKDLVRIKKLFPKSWNADREQQLNDESNHARLLLNELKKNSKVIVEDLAFSMQERLYRKYINLSESNSISASGIVHNMTEARALWIYKTYLKVGTNQEYKNCILNIIEDEKRHFIYNTDCIDQQDGFLTASIRSVDKAIFRTILPMQFGRIIFNSEKFWNNYYEGAALIESAVQEAASNERVNC
jgi:hypothetical protein